MSQTGAPQQVYQQLLDTRQFQPDPQQQQVVVELQRRYDWLLQQSAGPTSRWRWWHKLTGSAPPAQPAASRGLYLWGSVGRGKTWLLDLLFNGLPAGTGRRMHYHHFMNQINQRLQALGEGRDPLPQLTDDLLGAAKVLCLDEFIVNDIGNAMLLGGVLRRMFERDVMLVTTANTRPEQLYQNGLQRARFLPTIELIKQHCQVLELAGERDYRLRQLQQMPLYLFPDTPAQRERLRQRFFAMAAGPVRTAVELQINGRRIPTKYCAHSQVWLGFDTLCETARASQDYLQLAAEFSSVFVTGVRSMDEQDNDVVRRFIDLVDAFYDQKVKLIMTAEDAMDAIYSGQRLAFEFRRTRSRLQEMQSSDYLATAHRML